MVNINPNLFISTRHVNWILLLKVLYCQTTLTKAMRCCLKVKHFKAKGKKYLCENKKTKQNKQQNGQ